MRNIFSVTFGCGVRFIYSKIMFYCLNEICRSETLADPLYFFKKSALIGEIKNQILGFLGPPQLLHEQGLLHNLYKQKIPVFTVCHLAVCLECSEGKSSGSSVAIFGCKVFHAERIFIRGLDFVSWSKNITKEMQDNHSFNAIK